MAILKSSTMFLGLGAFLLGASLTACSEADEPILCEPGEIMPGAALTAEVQSRAPMNGFSTSVGYATIAYTTTTTAKPSNYSTGTKLIDNLLTLVVDNTTKCQFVQVGENRTKKYYPETGYVNFYAYYPKVESPTYETSAIKASYTIDGTQDIMWATPVDGTSAIPKAKSNNGTAPTQQQPNFAFVHKLQQIKFCLKAGTGWDTSDNNSKVKSISITNTYKTVSLNVVTGELTWTGGSDALLVPTGGNGSYEVKSGAGNTLSDVLMIKPDQNSLNLTVTLVGGTVYTLTGITFTPAAAKSHLITLTFNRAEIEPTVTYTAWDTGTGAERNVW